MLADTGLISIPYIEAQGYTFCMPSNVAPQSQPISSIFSFSLTGSFILATRLGLGNIFM